MKKKNIFILSISSDIGASLAKFWLSKGHSVSGTYRKKSDLTKDLEQLGINLYHLDLKSPKSCLNFSGPISNSYKWDTISLVLVT